jgi:hypothetical protein
MNLENHFNYSPLAPKSPFAPLDFQNLMSLCADVINAETIIRDYQKRIRQLENQIFQAHKAMLDETAHCFTEHIDTIYVECGNLHVIRLEKGMYPEPPKKLVFKEAQLRKMDYAAPSAQTFRNENV